MLFKRLILVCLIGWLSIFKHITIIPSIDWDEHEVTGFEFKIKFWVGKGK